MKIETARAIQSATLRTRAYIDDESLPDRCGGRKHWLVQAMGHGFGSWMEGSHGFADVK